jgi:alpha-glucosidase
MPMVADNPSAYERQPGFDFIEKVPTTWDGTRFVAGEVGEYVFVARRRGDTWYLGGINNWAARNVALPLDFLGETNYRMTVYSDDPSRKDDPNAVRIERNEVTSRTLSAMLEPGGGVAAIFERE